MKSNIYRRIMIATDGSENAKKAVSSGLEVAKLSEADVYAVHVMPTDSFSSISDDPRMPPWEELYEALKEEGEDIIGYVEQEGKDAGVRVESVLLEGDPAHEILEFAENNLIDLIVLGTMGVVVDTFGTGAIERFLLGGVAENVVRHSKVQVLVVR